MSWSVWWPLIKWHTAVCPYFRLIKFKKKNKSPTYIFVCASRNSRMKEFISVNWSIELRGSKIYANVIPRALDYGTYVLMFLFKEYEAIQHFIIIAAFEYKMFENDDSNKQQQQKLSTIPFDYGGKDVVQWLLRCVIRVSFVWHCCWYCCWHCVFLLFICRCMRTQKKFIGSQCRPFAIRHFCSMTVFGQK